MSRTYKDTPYLNPKTKYGRKRADITVEHDHHNLGRTLTYGGFHSWQTDEYKPVTCQVEKLTHVFNHEITEDMNIETRYNAHGRPLTFIVETVTVTRMQYTGKTVTRTSGPASTINYADHCTINEVPTIYGWNQYRRVMYSDAARPTCSTSIYPHYDNRNRPLKWQRNNYHRQHRTAARTNDSIIAKLYNSGTNLEEFDWDDGGYTTHNGWWD